MNKYVFIFFIFLLSACEKRKPDLFKHGDEVCFMGEKVIILRSWCCGTSYDIAFNDGRTINDIYESSGILKDCEKVINE